MTDNKSQPPRDWEYYQEKFRELFEQFTRDVLVDQADHDMNMVGFTAVIYEPLRDDPREG